MPRRVRRSSRQEDAFCLQFKPFYSLPRGLRLTLGNADFLSLPLQRRLLETEAKNGGGGEVKVDSYSYCKTKGKTDEWEGK